MANPNERPASGQRRPPGIVFINERRERTRISTENQLIGGLRSLGHLRRDTDGWKADGAIGLPPQPATYELKLGELRATEIWWGPT